MESRQLVRKMATTIKDGNGSKSNPTELMCQLPIHVVDTRKTVKSGFVSTLCCRRFIKILITRVEISWEESRNDIKSIA